MSGRREADDPAEWILRARSNLRLAQVQEPEVYLEELCFNAHQCAEKAIKAVFVRNGWEFPHTHNLARLPNCLGANGVAIPGEIERAGNLTRFAVEARYPSVGNEVTPEEHREAIEIATEVVHWAEGSLGAE
jgi:HEPN domain-containing protein